MSSRDHDGMLLQQAEARMLAAALRGDDQERDRITRGWARDGWPFAVLPGAFAEATKRRFRPETEHRVITRFAQRVIERAPGAGGLLVRDVEATLRIALGESDMIPGGPPEQLRELMYAGLLALADELALAGQQIEDLLAAAQRGVEGARQLTDAPVPPLLDSFGLGRYRRVQHPYLRDEDLLPDPPAELRAPRAFTTRRAARRAKPVTKAGRYLRAALVRTSDIPDTEEIDNMDLFRIHRATLAAALPHYLPQDPRVGEMTRLARTARDAYANELDVLKAEYVVRILLGEELPLDGITKKDIYLSSALMLQVIAQQWRRDDDAIRTVITQAEADLADDGHQLA